MNYFYGALCMIFGLVNLNLVREAVKTGETQFRMAPLRVRKADNPRRFSLIIVLQSVLSFLMFLVGMYWFNPPA